MLSRDLMAVLNTAIQFLVECRALSASMGNAIKFLKTQVRNHPAGQVLRCLHKPAHMPITFTRRCRHATAKHLSLLLHERPSCIRSCHCLWRCQVSKLDPSVNESAAKSAIVGLIDNYIQVAAPLVLPYPAPTPPLQGSPFK